MADHTRYAPPGVGARHDTADETRDLGISHHRGIGVEIVVTPRAKDQTFGFEGRDHG